MVSVLLSTYNGARYLPAQLDSVLAQDQPDVRLLVRDDGSTDRTVAVLDAYAARHPSMQIVRGRNVGVIRSFFELLAHPAARGDYVALCDQDDVWDRDKLSRAVAILGGGRGTAPAMYCGRLRVVDDALRPLFTTPLPRRGPSFRNALVENIATGCTMVLNERAHELLRQSLPTENVVMHDWWAYLVLSALGEVVFDPEPRMSYRQHGGNAVGTASGVQHWRGRVRRFRDPRNRNRLTAQAAEVDRRYGHVLPPEHRRVLRAFVASRGAPTRRLRFALGADVWRQRPVDTVILRALIAMGYV